MTGRAQLPNLSDATPDYEKAIDPLTAAQTMALVRLMVDHYYGGPQAEYKPTDLALAHAELDETLAAAFSTSRSCEEEDR